MSAQITPVRRNTPAEIAERIRDAVAAAYATDNKVDDTELQGIIDMLANDEDGITPDELGAAEELLSEARDMFPEAFADYRQARDIRNALIARGPGAVSAEDLTKAQTAVTEAIGEIDAVSEIQRVLARLVLGLDERRGRGNPRP